MKVFGKNIPTWAVYGSVIGGGGALVYAYVREKNKKAAAAAAATTANTSGGYGTYAYGYGSAAQFGYGAYAYGAYTEDPYGYGSGYAGIGTNYGYGDYGAGSSEPSSTQATTNAQWSAAVVSALTNQGVGYTGQQVLGAIAPYLAGQPVSAAQGLIVQQAIAVEGYPPVPGPSGNPPGIVTASTTGGGTGTGQTTAANVKVPNVIGRKDLDTAEGIIATAGLSPASRGDSGTGNKGSVTSQSPAAGTMVKPGTTVLLTYTVPAAKK
jgi:PASTA domain